MGRPKGSKNKKTLAQAREIKEKDVIKNVVSSSRIEGITTWTEPVATVKRRSRRGQKISSSSDTTSPEVEKSITSVSDATTKTEATSGRKKYSLRTVQGWVNLQRSPDRGRIKSHYYTGGDIHLTEEDAKRVASANTVGQFYFRCEVRE